MREDTLQVLEMLPLENKSDKMFDPGPGAVELPLPEGFTGAEAGQGERKLEVRQNHGMSTQRASSSPCTSLPVGLHGFDSSSADRPRPCTSRRRSSTGSAYPRSPSSRIGMAVNALKMSSSSSYAV